jgi:small subunit ribosomal protein S16
MAVKIRLRRMGARKRPFYRLVVADGRAPRDGRFIETLGYYNPCVEPSQIKIDADRAAYWLRCGAQPSETAAALLKKQGISSNQQAVSDTVAE